MRERLAAETTEAAKPPAAPVAHGSPVVMRMLALQRGAGNRAVTRLLAREPVADKAPDFGPTRFVFILGPEGDAALKSAEAYYTSALMSSPGKPLYLHVASAYTQKNRAEYEDDPVLYTKSTYYSPKEI